MSYTYVIIDSSEVSSVDFSKVMQRDSEGTRYSLDGAKALLKFNGDTPSFLIGKPQYDHAEILAELATPEWTDPDAII